MTRDRFFVMTVADTEGGTHAYFLRAGSRRDARRQARAWVSEAPWSATLVSVKPGVEQGNARRLFVIAGMTLAVSAPMIAVAMVIGLSLEGAL